MVPGGHEIQIGERWWAPGGAAANAAAIRLTEAAGIDAGTGGFPKWLFFHSNQWFDTSLPANPDPIGQQVFHTAVGAASALDYAGLFHRLLPGPRWLRPRLLAGDVAGAGLQLFALDSAIRIHN